MRSIFKKFPEFAVEFTGIATVNTETCIHTLRRLSYVVRRKRQKMENQQ
jgi:hypothetical protein